MCSTMRILHRIRISSINMNNIRMSSNNDDNYTSTTLPPPTYLKKTLMEGTGLVQHGDRVQELPLIVRIIGELEANTELQSEITGLPPTLGDNAIPDNMSDKIPPHPISPDSPIHKLIRNEFLRCSCKKDIFTLLYRCHTISANIAAGAVYRMNQLQEVSPVGLNIPALESELMDRLVEVIGEGDVSAIIVALSDPPPECVVRDRLVNEILVRISEGKLTISQLCDVVDLFGKNKHVPKFAESIDKCWIGFAEGEPNFTDVDLMRCIRILEHLKSSQRVVLGVLEKNAHRLWWRLRPSQIGDIMDVMEKNSISSSKLLSVVGKWTNMNVHSVSEETLTDIVTGLTKTGYTDDQLEKALERYIKHRGVNIHSPALILAVIEHSFLFRVRNVHILGGCCEYFIAHAKTSGPAMLKPLLTAIGWLNFLPSNETKFWQEIESVFSDRFHTMNPYDILDVMLSCVYLEKHPMNFVSKIFNPSFLEKINSSPDVESLRRKLKLLDVALSLECKSYEGPLLPKDVWSKTLWHDGRIRRLINNISDSLEVVAGGRECLSTFVMLPNLYTSSLYIVDIMMHPKGLKNSILNMNFRSDRNVNVAVLVHPSEHYSSNGDFLVGPQLMRIRHFRKLGLKVVSLKYDSLSRLKMHRRELEHYIKSQLKQAQSALDCCTN